MNPDFFSDTVVVGAGIAGAALGAHLARRGLEVTLLESEERPGYHSTGRSAAFWLESYGGAAVSPLTAASRAFLEQPPANFSPHGFLSPRGAIHVARDSVEQPFADIPPGVATERLDPARLKSLVPGLRDGWSRGLAEPSCRDIDVAGLHQAYLSSLTRMGGKMLTSAELAEASYKGGRWAIRLRDGREGEATQLVNAAGAWADEVAKRCGIEPLGFVPKRRTMMQLRVDRQGMKGLPLVADTEGRFYFRGEGEQTIWLSPHDETDCDPCDAAPEELAVAEAIDRLGTIVDWKVEKVERKWAGLRTFSPDRNPVFGRDPGQPAFFWYAGQGGTGIQSQPAAAALARAIFMDDEPTGVAGGLSTRAFLPERFF
ncbi:NAD(P)/FAD-dependent oxidoreductase [Sphingomicrobium sediminis]|uniref:FAD-binding oxidoreductase n=1 Tax=Sphingomicrobium sediminis TaxID=2950949 RepID=A0A9X2EKP0_9SPHN|nr:FAD-binding oxidoreductase [Sphingomicrobium sediminis]